MKIKIKCDYCYKLIKVYKYRLKHHKHNFCNKKCYDKWQLNRIKTKCTFCKKIIFKIKCNFKLHKNHFCNQICFNKYRDLNKVYFECRYCHKVKKVYRCIAKIKKFCNNKCFKLYWEKNNKKNIKIHNNFKIFCACGCGKRIMQYNILSGRKRSFISGHNAYGFSHSMKTRQKISENRLKYLINKGEESKHYKYNKKFNRVLKDFICKRDDYVCQNIKCNIPDKECIQGLHVHHIDYNKNNSDPINLIALCNKCHSRTNYNREYWENFYKAIQIKRKVHLLELYAD